jgi:hypothetical protein
MPHTDLETRQINDLCNITKTKLGKNINIKDINNTINVMIDMTYNDKNLNNIYNKKYIIIESLKEMHKSTDAQQHNHTHKIIDMYNSIIDKKMNYEQYKNKKRNSCKCF